jgi:hypothetical protein
MLGLMQPLARRLPFAIALLITTAIVVVLSSMSRMAFLRGSLVAEPDAVLDDGNQSSEPSELPMGEPLDDAQITAARYVIADPSVRSALMRAGRPFTLTLNEQGVYKAPSGSRGVTEATIDLLRRTDADVDGDRKPDALVPLSITVAGQTFVELAVLKNNDGVAEYIGGYPLGNKAQFIGVAQQADGSIRIRFSYLQADNTPPVDASLVVRIRAGAAASRE